MNKILKIAMVLTLILCMVTLVNFVRIQYVGFHNIDLSYNMCLISNDQNGGDYREREDFYDVDKSMSYVDLYIYGNQQQSKSFVNGLFFSFMVGVLLTLLIKGDMNERMGKKKNNTR